MNTIKKIFTPVFFLFLSVKSLAGDYVITEYGATKDSIQINTTAIQNAIDKAELNGGGTVVVPKGVFLWGCDNVKILGVKLHNSGFWTTHLYQCNDVLIENCDIRSPFKPIKAPSTDGVDIDVCKRVTIRKCSISVNDDAVCIKGGKGPTAHKLLENGIVEDILVEDCDFGDSHGVLTFGSESIHARNVLLRNCTVNSKTPLLRIKMRPDTYQIFENIRLENVTGSCGTLLELKPWKQFFTMEGTNEKPFGIVRDIVLSNINVNCDSFAEIKGNPDDKITNFVFENVTAKADDPTLKTEYKTIKLKNVVVNGKPLTMKKKKVQLKEPTYD